MPVVLGLSPVGVTNLWGFRYEINQPLEGILWVLFFPAIMVLEAALKISNHQKPIYTYPYPTAVKQCTYFTTW